MKTIASIACGMFLFTLGATARADDPPPPHRGPPPEALAACQSLASGDACSFTMHDHALTGTCQAPEGRPLACRPSNMPMPPKQSSGQSN